MEKQKDSAPDFDEWAEEFSLDPKEFRTDRWGIAGINFKKVAHVMGKAAFISAEPVLVPAEEQFTSPGSGESVDDDNIESMVVLSETS